MTESAATKVWQNKLDFLLVEEAKVVEPTQKFKLQQDITEAKAKIKELKADCAAAGLDLGKEILAPIDISRFGKYAPVELIGRQDETKILNDAWNKICNAETPRPHILTFVALGGEGKSSLVEKWATEMAHQDWPGCEAVFAWSFYSQGTREQTAVSSDLFLAEALTFFGDKEMSRSPQSAYDKGRRLAHLVGERRSLLILDGLEPLQYAPNSPTSGGLKDAGLIALLKGLAATNHGLCVVTTRYSIPDLRSFIGKNVREENLPRLSTEAGVLLLQSLGVKGSFRRINSGIEGRELLNEFEQLVEDVKGHALTLTFLGSYLGIAHAGDIRKRDLVKFEEADATIQGGHAFRVIESYENWFKEDRGNRPLMAILRLMGLFERHVDAGCFAALCKAPPIPGLTEPLVSLPKTNLNIALQRLQDAKLISVTRDGAGSLVSLDAHPLLREYFGKQLRLSGNTWRAAHRRIYEHLCSTTRDKPKPRLEDLQPLYQAISHGCQASMQQDSLDEVYIKRIQRGLAGYSSEILGAFGSDLGAVACFFDEPWSTVSSNINVDMQAWLLNEAAICLRALGRLSEALDPLRAGLAPKVSKEHWKNATIAASNLSELELTLGEVEKSVASAVQSTIYADNEGDAFFRSTSRVTLADAQHQAGISTDCEIQFREAEIIQIDRQSDYPLLYSLQGFRYCDFLLSKAECAAWRHEMLLVERSPILGPLGDCASVSERASRTLGWFETRGQDILSSAHDHLTLGRAAFYQAILEGSKIETARLEIEIAVRDLYRSSQQHHMPRGLLTRAWLRIRAGTPTGPESAQSDLDEAWEIAERGPMPLFLADIHLHRTRLFFREATYPWKSTTADLAEARRLIIKHGYLRRMEELEDAEHAIIRAVVPVPNNRH